jgi:hypothetical protein
LRKATARTFDELLSALGHALRAIAAQEAAAGFAQ